jgi:hypothetical protein
MFLFFYLRKQNAKNMSMKKQFIIQIPYVSAAMVVV